MADLGPVIYSPERSIEVYKTSKSYLEAQHGLSEKISDLGWCYQYISNSIPQTMENFWSGHFFPYIESNDELQISMNLALFGLYKQSFMSLRNALEVGILSVYYNINDDGHLVVKNWLRSKPTSDANTPRTQRIWKVLRSNLNISTFDEKFDLKSRFDELSFLHDYVHTKGHKFSNRFGRLKSNHQTFEEDMLLKWIATYEDVVVLLITLHMLKYPITSIEFDWRKKVGVDNPFPVLEKFQIERLKKVLPPGYFDVIHDIAKDDKETMALMDHITSIPNMTEAEIEAQQLALDKISIEHGPGFVAWEKQQLQMEDYFNLSDAEKEKNRKRYSHLREWAEKADLMQEKQFTRQDTTT